MAKIPKKLLRKIYDMHSIIGEMQAALWNDRSTERAQRIQELAKEGLKIGQEIIDSQDPM